MKTDIEIAQAARLRPIMELVEELGLGPHDVEPYGHHIAKLRLDILDRSPNTGKLILVTGITPTSAGEGKSTISVGLAQAMNRVGRRTVLCLREPSLGPCMGIKGGAAGGGFSQVVPMEEINLHFTGDLHAVGATNNLLSAMLDNHLHFGNELGIDPRQILWKRAVDMNDRALREIVVGLGGRVHGVPREDGFLITVASEVMAILCLANDLADLERRFGQIVVAYDGAGSPVRAAALKAPGAMTLLMRQALKPNLVQTLEGTPALVHGGPFANIAHGCNSLLATRMGMALGEFCVTEAGFGADLGAEKFFDIKCRYGGLEPDAAVVVATVRALKRSGGSSADDLTVEDPDALRAGLANLGAHLDIVGKFGVPPVVAINAFESDAPTELEAVQRYCAERDIPSATATVHADGGEGGTELAETVIDVAEGGASRFHPLYDVELSIKDKIETIAREIYGADGVEYGRPADRSIERLTAIGLGELPVCIAKTQYSLSDDPTLLGRPTGFKISVTDVRPSAGAGFLVVLTGDIMTMPGLPRRPAAEAMRVDAQGSVHGLF